MKVVAIIPARYNSSRFRGKPLADICGKPMIWWVYNQVCKSRKINEVYVATDNWEIKQECEKWNINCIMTLEEHKTSTERVYEVAKKIKSDIYIVINGDEPLIDSLVIEKIIPDSLEGFFAANLMTKIKNPVEVVDPTNIKVVTDQDNYALFMSRNPIPYPKASMEYEYYKHLGVLAYKFEALKFFAETEKGKNEKIEDVNELRFIEHGKKIKMIPVNANTLSVDTPKDLEHVIQVIRNQLTNVENG
ncbi:3-deoxy-manno-octulosonate cytidylyltransferase [Mediterraneibacter glycyrrhizinilyticus]|uniref:3-deoxy-manno-octulosonate cytidylyltransferase n=1 Tax=Mediterraneibacter glycyrrhizinilyticus TaxID=342942 RepID=UPI001D08D3A3|nr:3-deoxy-manno-octulosonate cytidylyltransferase [Mediterraneibacter glycyrrhizinilyticus]MCB6308729.1 3-deoxy-manno-octulosonate cytidylyltransferase [Lachnospiraceae bacterium 210521-DFI.1.109]MCB6425872.1 3-deoxy-manno-octulosonate cytidylyltransferase [Mediterraneibacter glycyrrhizinilyticus]